MPRTSPETRGIVARVTSKVLVPQLRAGELIGDPRSNIVPSWAGRYDDATDTPAPLVLPYPYPTLSKFRCIRRHRPVFVHHRPEALFKRRGSGRKVSKETRSPAKAVGVTVLLVGEGLSALEAWSTDNTTTCRKRRAHRELACAVAVHRAEPLSFFDRARMRLGYLSTGSADKLDSLPDRHAETRVATKLCSALATEDRYGAERLAAPLTISVNVLRHQSTP